MIKALYLSLALLTVNITHQSFAQKIDRKAVVYRHNVVINQIDTLGSLTVGNGRFAFTVDVTGLQSFPQLYANGVPLGTQSEWGWHNFPNKGNYKVSETLKAYDFNNTGRKALYAVQFKEEGRNHDAVEYYRSNPHRLQLGNVGLEITNKNGTLVKPEELTAIHQVLNLWTGEITSNFKVEGTPVKVITIGDGIKDAIAVKIISPLLVQKRIKVKFRFPYPTNQFTDKGVNYEQNDLHQTILTQGSSSALFSRKLDNDRYYVAAKWTGNSSVQKVSAHNYALLPTTNNFELSVQFSQSKLAAPAPAFVAVSGSSVASWGNYWRSGAAIDLAGSTDVRAKELERRVILSQYLLRVQEAGNYPPQETGLTYNSWYGRPHMEMLWWHTSQYALWGRAPIMEQAMQWYFKAYKGAEEIAKRQGYEGVRWQKMSDNTGGESPSSVGSFLIWQQPNVIYQAELLYRDKPSVALLKKYEKLISATANFMVSFATYDNAKGRYNLGKGVIPAQECHIAAETFNSPFELAYWKWALQVAQQWRKRLGLAPNVKWKKVIDQLAPLAQQDGLYKSAENVTDSYSANSKVTIDHPAVLMPISMLPYNNMVDTAVMQRTFDKVENVWHWEHTWGWDFPMVAMAATRLNQPEKAMDALFKNVITNTYLANGHNYQTPRLTLYMPGNGSLLAAVALMCTGDDGNKVANPGFPKNGKWQVKWEGIKRLP